MEDYIRTVFKGKIADAISRPLPELTRRDLVVPVFSNKATAIIGMRRTGKTSLLWNHIRERTNKGIPREASLFISFEDDRLHPLKLSYMELLMDEYFQMFPAQRQYGANTALYLDEIQNVPEWERFVRRALDELPVQVILTGTSAKLLSAEIATSMRGRSVAATLYPFSFREYGRHHHKLPDKQPLNSARRAEIANLFKHYLLTGGFPEIQQYDKPAREQILRSYVDTVVLRDVLERHNIGQTQAVMWMLRFLLANPAASFSVTKFYQDLKSQGYPISRETLYELLAHLEDAFLFRTVEIDALSERKRRVNPRKVYPIDTGLIPLFDRTGNENRGRLLETAVLLELLRRGAAVGFVNTPSGFEVDFIARFHDGREQLIQVTEHLDSEVVRNREFRALEDAHYSYPDAECIVISGESPVPASIPANISVVTAWEWFLNGEVA